MQRCVYKFGIIDFPHTANTFISLLMKMYLGSSKIDLWGKVWGRRAVGLSWGVPWATAEGDTGNFLCAKLGTVLRCRRCLQGPFVRLSDLLIRVRYAFGKGRPQDQQSRDGLRRRSSHWFQLQCQ